MSRPHLRHPGAHPVVPPLAYRVQGYEQGVVLQPGDNLEADRIFDNLGLRANQRRRFDVISHLANVTLARELESLPQSHPSLKQGEASAGIHYVNRRQQTTTVATVSMQWPGGPDIPWQPTGYAQARRTPQGSTIVRSMGFAQDGHITELTHAEYDRERQLAHWTSFKTQAVGRRLVKAVDMIEPLEMVEPVHHRLFARLGYSAPAFSSRLCLEDQIALMVETGSSSTAIPLSPPIVQADRVLGSIEASFFDLVPSSVGPSIRLSHARDHGLHPARRVEVSVFEDEALIPAAFGSIPPIPAAMNVPTLAPTLRF